MTDLLTTITGFSFLGAFVAFLIAAIVLKFRSIRLTLILGVTGLLGGWVGMMMYMFLSGGVQNDSIWAVIMPVVMTFIFCYLVLRTNKIKIRFPKKRPKWMTNKGLGIILFGCLFLSLAYLSLPSSYGTTMSIADYSFDDFGMPEGRVMEGFTLVEYDGNDISTVSTSNQVGIDIQKASIKFPRIAEDPEVGGYIEYKVQFSVSTNNWDRPYIKLVVFIDNDNSGSLTSGDALWGCAHMKYHMSTGGTTTEGYWKSFLLYGPSGQSEPLYQTSILSFTDGSYVIMPLLSTSDFEVVWNDNGKVFGNTPEQYTSPEDQFSMQVNSQGYLSFVEDEWYNWVGYNAGSSKTISGKIYCPAEMEGKTCGLVVQAFDHRFQADPWDNGATPLKTSTKIFTIAGGGGPGPDPDPDNPPVVDISWVSWAIVGVLGLGCIGGTAAVIKYGTKMAKP